jgi:hypothetical protein
MIKRLVLLFATIGYLMVVWFFVLNPYEHAMSTLFFVCPACPVVESIGPTWPVYLLILGPINAATYSLIALVVVQIVFVFRKRHHHRSS